MGQNITYSVLYLLVREIDCVLFPLLLCYCLSNLVVKEGKLIHLVEFLDIVPSIESMVVKYSGKDNNQE